MRPPMLEVAADLAKAHVPIYRELRRRLAEDGFTRVSNRRLRRAAADEVVAGIWFSKKRGRVSFDITASVHVQWRRADAKPRATYDVPALIASDDSDVAEPWSVTFDAGCRADDGITLLISRLRADAHPFIDRHRSHDAIVATGRADRSVAGVGDRRRGSLWQGEFDFPSRMTCSTNYPEFLTDGR
ncbi:MAG: hypothetical protein JNL07_12585 [Rhodospirillales bacterium]|nr:hypothetical protein [Rhodospirillales bacterium]